MAEYQKYYARHESDDGSYGLKSYWTSSQTVEFEDGQTLEEYKAALKEEIDAKGDELGYSLDEGEIYLYGNGQKISTSEMRLRVQPTIALDDISNLSIRLSKGRVRFTWQDPSDVVFSELTLVEWAGTRVVRKIGSAPDDPTDGTVLINSTTRDAYISDPYFDTTARDGVYYYYRFFPYDTDGNFYGRTCGVIFKPVTLEPVDVPYVENTYTYTGETITPEFINYDKNKMTRSGANSAKNAGTYTVTFTLKEGYKWSDDTTAPRDVTWSIGKANGELVLNHYSDSIDAGDLISITATRFTGNITYNIDSGSEIINSIIINQSTGAISISTNVIEGHSSITFTATESSNYLSCSKTFSIAATIETLAKVSYHSGYNWGAPAVINLNNEIHNLGGTNGAGNMHYMWNGGNWSSVSTIPVRLENQYKATLLNNEIHVMVNSAHYKYSNDQWTTVSTLPKNLNNAGACISYNNNIYLIGGTTIESSTKANYFYPPIYRWDGTTWELVELITDGIRASYSSGKVSYYLDRPNIVIHQNKIHVLGGSSGAISSHWTIDSNGIELLSDTLPTQLQCQYGKIGFVSYNNEIHGFYSNNHYKWNGSTWQQASTVPFSFTYASCTVRKNKIYLISPERMAMWNGTEWFYTS